ncbi:hypothetical protein BGX26_007430 [Mortierella sp. AD094]|nr:hypothetical protein BGX26_007430 [Mortierella sp. AD094]
MSTSEFGRIDAKQQARLDAFIDALTDHRQYHANLVPELRELLSSVQSSASHSQFHKTNDTNAEALGKQIKRLFNQSLSTLTKWSELLEESDATNVAPRDRSNDTTNSSRPDTTNDNPAVTIRSASKTQQAVSQTIAATSTILTSNITTKEKSGAKSRSVPAIKPTKTVTTTRDQIKAKEDMQVQKRAGQMHGARKNVDLDNSKAETPPRTSKSTGTTVIARQLIAKTEISTSTTASSVSAANEKSIYETDRPTYAHIAALVDVGFLGVRTLELMGKYISTNLFEIEKARSNLISKIIQLGMKKRALQELGYLREQLVQCAMSLWKEQDLGTLDEQEQLRSKSKSESRSANPSSSSSVDSIKKSYQHLFTFPFPKVLSTFITDSVPNALSATSVGLEQVLTFIRLVQALHNNALRCWMDVRNGSLAYLLPEMMSQPSSPYDWCMCIANIHRQAGQQSLDALFRLLFIAAGKAVDIDPTRETKDGMIWDKILRCGAEFEKSTRDGQTREDILLLLRSYRTMYEFLGELAAVDTSNARFLEWRKHFVHLSSKVDDTAIRVFVKSLQGDDQDMEMLDVATTKEQQPLALSRHGTSPSMECDTRPKVVPTVRSITEPTISGVVISVERVLSRLDDAVKALRKFEDSLQYWRTALSSEKDLDSNMEKTKNALLVLEQDLSSFPSKNLPTSILQNIARIFRSMDNIRSVGSKIMDKYEKEQKKILTDSTSDEDVALRSLISAGMADRRKEAIRPLEAAIECYLHWLRDDLGADSSLSGSDTTKNPKTEARLVLANRYEVLGVCSQAVNDLSHALDCFNSGLCVLPLNSFRDIDTVALGELKTSQFPAAKLLNRRTRVLLMMEEPRFTSVVTSVPEFESKVTKHDVPVHIRGVVQEFERGLLSVLSVKTNQISHRSKEQIEILKHLMTRVYRGGRSLTNPIRRARVLVQLAILYQGQSDMDLQQEAQHLVEEAIEILKERDLKADFGLEHVRNYNLALAYSWNGILDRSRGTGLPRKSKPFQIALQLWEIILSDIECFASYEDAQLVNHQSKINKLRKYLPEPELLYDHLQMLADCLGMIDYRVLQVQVYLLMLRLCNGVLTMTEETCADAVRIYSRIGQAYLALGYSGKAKMALNHGKLVLEEMARASKDSALRGEVYATWLLVYSLYLTSIGHKAQGISAYNQAKYHSDQHQLLVGAREGVIGPLSRSGALSRKVEAKVFRAMIIVEASLARSQLLYYEGNLSEAISDSKRAGRQLSRIVSTLSAAIKTSQTDPAIVVPRPMDNPFLVNEQTVDQGESQAQERIWSENRQLRQGLEMLATQRFQWSIFRLLIEAYHQLGKLYLIQGSAREAEYFFVEGKYIATLAKAGKSLDRFMLDQAELQLRQHEWQGCQQILEELSMQEDESNAGALSWEIQDARIQLLRGDLYFETAQFELSMQAYFRTDDVLSHLMDKSFISGLEQLVIREPQTPREAKLVTIGRQQGIGGLGVLHWRSDASLGSCEPGTPDQAQFECVTLGGIKAAMGYRTGLILGLEGRRAQAYGLIEESKAEDPMAFTVAEYHFTKARLLILELEDAMAKHLMYALIPESALSVGLFRKTRTQKLESPPGSFNQSSILNDNGMHALLELSQDSHLSSPSVRVTRTTRRRRSQLASEPPFPNPSGARTKAQQVIGKDIVNQYHEILRKAREHLSAAYKHSIQIYSPHVVSDICSKQVYLSVLESCFHQEALQERASNLGDAIGIRGDSHWAMANRAACYLEMAKAVTQHREMHGLIKQKLNPDSPQGDQSWPRDIQIKEQPIKSDQQQQMKTSWLKKEPHLQRVGSKTINFIGLEKPRRLMLLENADGEQATETNINVKMEDEDMDLEQVDMKLEDLNTRRGKREYFNRQSQLRPSTSLGNERSFLEIMDKVYERDTLIMEEQPETFQRDFVDILPDQWTVVSLSIDVEHEVLYVNRLRANAMPLVVRLPLNRARLREGDDQDLGLRPDLGFDEEDEQEPGPPLSYKEAAEELQEILRGSQETLALTSSKHHASIAGLGGQATQKPVELTREAKAEWWSQRQELDDRLCALLGCMEDQWLCGLKGLIQSHNTPSDEGNLIGFKKTLDWIMSQAVNSMSSMSSVFGTRASGQQSSTSRRGSLVQLEINVDLCRVILHLGDQPTSAELKDLIYFLLDAYLYKNMSSPDTSSTSAFGGISMSSSSMPPTIEYSEVQFGRIALQIKEALRCYWQAETVAKNNGFDEGAHVILILDKHLQGFPWESCPVLRQEAVSRVPSMWFLRDRILQQKYNLSKSNTEDPFSEGPMSITSTNVEAGYTWDCEWRDLELDSQKTFYVLNPGGDLKNTEDAFKGYVKTQQGWDGIIGRAPLDLECINGLSKNDLYIYFGHSGGEQYIKSTQIRQLGHCAVSLLLGCSSGSLKSEGEFDPTGNAMNYLLAGCPAVVANLWDVTDKDLDRFSMAMFNLWGLAANRYDTKTLDKSRSQEDIDEIDDNHVERIGSEQADSVDGLRLSLVEAVKEAREECKLKYLVGAASVVYDS